jgi:iron complex outermembrane receptor protein
MTTGQLGASNCQKVTLLASSISAILSTQAAQAQDVADEILVTGSRIVRRDLDAASPIVTVDTARLENSSTISIESVLNQMPQFVPEGTQFDSGAASSGAVTLGTASVNLRGIGANRTLVLIDGRRAQPANASLVVDLNTVPTAAIERVETITGGASAVYGADALAGVVNFVLKDDFEGVAMDFQTGATAEGDGEETRFASMLGVNSGDGRSNVLLGVEWYKRGEVLQRDREFWRNGWADPATETGGFLNAAGYSPGPVTLFTGVPIDDVALAPNRPTQAALDAIFVPLGYAPGAVGPTSEIYFNPDNTPFTLNLGRNYNGPIMSMDINGDGYSGVRRLPNGNLAQVGIDGFAAIPLERRSVFGRATYAMNDNLSAFVQANYSHVDVETRGNYPPAITVWQAPIPADGRALPPALQALLASRPRPAEPWNLFRGLDFLGSPVSPTSKTSAYQLMAGVEGSFASRDWTWEAYISTGSTDVTTFYDNLPSLQRYQFLVAQTGFGVEPAATPTVPFPFTIGRNYAIRCPTGLPIFRATDPAASCIEGIESKMRPLWELTQNIAEFNLQGKIVDMKSGELRFAAGVSARENDFRYEPGEMNDNGSVIENPIGLFVSNNTGGSTEVKEIYGELLMPVAPKLNLELGYRYSDYDGAIGGVDTYKTLFDWSTTEKIRLRGGYQFATRAPNTEELFAGARLNTVNDFVYGDPCQASTTAPWGNVASNPNRAQVQALCRAIIGNSTSLFDTNTGSLFGPPGPNGFVRPGLPFFQAENEVPVGTPTLKAEEAKTWTIGAVFTGVGGLDNVTLSVDVYNIEITDAIATLDATFVYSKCFNARDSNPNYLLADPQGYCSKIRRNPISGERSEVDAPYLNAGILETTGLDLAVNWQGDLDSGSVYVNSLVTYLDRYEIQDAAGEPVLEVADTLASTQNLGGQFKYKLNTTIGYDFGGGDASIGLNWRYLPSIRDESAIRDPNTRILKIDSYSVFGLFARYSINDHLEFRGGIDNLFDEAPPIVGTRLPGTNGANDFGDRNADVTRADFYDVLGRRAYVGLKMSF